MPSLGQALSGVLKEYGWEQPIERYRALTIWDQVVGPSLARHCKAVEVKGETRYVVARNPSWRNEISFQKNDILHAINKELKTHVLKDIRIR